MEFEDVSEEVQVEMRRVAIAFEVEEWEEGDANTVHDFHAEKDNLHIVWHISPGGKRVYLSVINDKEEVECSIYPENYTITPPPQRWSCDGCHFPFTHVMARGLYRLGFEDEDILSQLPPLSAHEKIEARLSMPREFWPKAWLKQEEDRN